MKDHLLTLVREREPLQARNLVREYLQARILGAMQRAGAMTTLAFQGGSCLRFLFALPRYSEDLDFTLEGEPSQYDLPRYLRALRTELAAERYQVGLRVRQHRAVHSALVGFPAALALADGDFFLARSRKGEYKLLSALCPHSWGVIYLEDTCFMCPSHGWRFEYYEGNCINGPIAQMYSFAVTARNGRLFAEIPNR